MRVFSLLPKTCSMVRSGVDHFAGSTLTPKEARVSSAASTARAASFGSGTGTGSSPSIAAAVCTNSAVEFTWATLACSSASERRTGRARFASAPLNRSTSGIRPPVCRLNSETADTASDLFSIAAAYRAFAIESPMYYEIMFGKFDPSEQSIETALDGLARLVGRIERGIANGSIRLPADLDAASATAWLWATCHGLISLELGNIAVETIEWSGLYDAAMRTALSSLSASSVAAR